MIEDFFYEFWPSVVITFSCAAIFFIATLYFVKNKRDSAEYERYKRAKEKVIDVIESSLINKQPITPERIKHLIIAVQREENTELKDSPKNLLEDLEFRFEWSKHLESGQQIRYIEQVEMLISEIESKSKSSVPLSFEAILVSLKENIKTGKKDDALIDFDELSAKIVDMQNHGGDSSRSVASISIIFSVLVGIASLLLFVFINLIF